MGPPKQPLSGLWLAFVVLADFVTDIASGTDEKNGPKHSLKVLVKQSVLF
jgi:hypothetical protein